MKQLGSLITPAFLPEVFDAVPKEETAEAIKKSRIKKLRMHAKKEKDKK